MSKKDKLLELAAQLQGLYPQLEVVLIEDFEEPQRVSFLSRIEFERMMDSYGVSGDPEDYGEHVNLIDYEVEYETEEDDDDDFGGFGNEGNDGGMLQ